MKLDTILTAPLTWKEISSEFLDKYVVNSEFIKCAHVRSGIGIVISDAKRLVTCNLCVTTEWRKKSKGFPVLPGWLTDHPQTRSWITCLLHGLKMQLHGIFHFNSEIATNILFQLKTVNTVEFYYNLRLWHSTMLHCLYCL